MCLVGSINLTQSVVELMAPSVIEPELCEIEVYIAEIVIFDLFGCCDLDLDR